MTAVVMWVAVSIPHSLDSVPLRSVTGWAPEWEWSASVPDSAPQIMANQSEIRCSHCGRPTALRISISTTGRPERVWET